MIQIRDNLFKELTALQVVVKKDNKDELTTFSHDEAVEITNLLLAEMMGPSALNRLSSLIRFYTTGEDGIEKGAAARAAAMARSTEVPMFVRHFYSVFSPRRVDPAQLLKRL